MIELKASIYKHESPIDINSRTNWKQDDGEFINPNSASF
jgi:hypothetical protein